MIPLIENGETVVFVVMLLASIIAVAVIFERAFIYNRITSRKSGLFIREFSERLRAGDITGIMELVKAAKKDIYSGFVDFSLTYYSNNHQGLEVLLSGKITEEKIRLERRLTILNTLGNNAPFIGLLGTVLGVIKAFHGLGTLGSTGAEVVMRSISRALIATAAGLFIAIPVVMANNYFSRKMKIILQNLEILSKEFIAGKCDKDRVKINN